jgi:hypothetical protein
MRAIHISDTIQIKKYTNQIKKIQNSNKKYTIQFPTLQFLSKNM